jgi:hypothetical protein
MTHGEMDYTLPLLNNTSMIQQRGNRIAGAHPAIGLLSIYSAARLGLTPVDVTRALSLSDYRALLDAAWWLHGCDQRSV